MIHTRIEKRSCEGEEYFRGDFNIESPFDLWSIQVSKRKPMYRDEEYFRF